MANTKRTAVTKRKYIKKTNPKPTNTTESMVSQQAEALKLARVTIDNQRESIRELRSIIASMSKLLNLHQ